MSSSSPWKALWSAVSNKIDRELPGEPLWSQTIPIGNGDVGEGLAIRKNGPEGYILVYYQLVPVEVDTAGNMIGGEEAGDWNVEVGYQKNCTTLQAAIEEARGLLAGLPASEHLQDRGYDFFLNLLKG